MLRLTPPQHWRLEDLHHSPQGESCDAIEYRHRENARKLHVTSVPHAATFGRQ